MFGEGNLSGSVGGWDFWMTVSQTPSQLKSGFRSGQVIFLPRCIHWQRNVWIFQEIAIQFRHSFSWFPGLTQNLDQRVLLPWTLPWYPICFSWNVGSSKEYRPLSPMNPLVLPLATFTKLNCRFTNQQTIIIIDGWIRGPIPHFFFCHRQDC